MDGRQLVAGLGAISILFVCILELIRRGRLREEYTWVWVTAGVAMVLLAIAPGLLRWVADLIGAYTAASAAYFLALVFLLAINLHHAVVISTLSTQLKNLAQHQALMAHELERLRSLSRCGLAGAALDADDAVGATIEGQGAGMVGGADVAADVDGEGHAAAGMIGLSGEHGSTHLGAGPDARE